MTAPIVIATGRASLAPGPAGPELLRSDALVVGHGGRALLPPIDLSIRQGEFWAVLGRNGSGKSTWFRTLLGLVPPVAGRVSRSHAGLRVAYVPQRAAFDAMYPVLVEDVVRMGAARGLDFGARADVGAALAEVDATTLRYRPFRELSEGQKQRVLLARLAAADAELALLDEPTAAMDVVAEREAFVLLAELRKRRGMAVVVVSHFLGVARDFADRALLLDREAQAIAIGAPGEVFDGPVFRRAYGPPEQVCDHG